MQKNQIIDETPAKAVSTADNEPPYPSNTIAWYVVGILTFVYVFSFIDRQILNLLVRPIRRDLGISDTQMSLLMGFSFALFYTVFGLPLGRLADSRSRRTIIAIGFAFWSLFTTGCGLAKNFTQMLLLRMGVGVGEAALSPAAYSIISDYFPPKKRATAISVYSMGIYIGSGLAYIIGGLVARVASAQEVWTVPIAGAIKPWQMVFFIVGIPGIFFAMLLYTIREPFRRGLRQTISADGKATRTQAPMSVVFSYLRANWLTFLCHNVGFAFLSFSSYGTSAWVPTFFVRNHGWTESQAGQVYGWIIAIAATLGVASGGWFADRLAERGYRNATMRVGLIVSIVWFPFGLVYPFVQDAWIAALFLIPTVFFASAPFGVAPAAITQIMPNDMRAQAAAIYLFVVNLIGLGIGPTAVAMTTDYIFNNDKMVNYSICIVTVVAHIISSLLLWVGLKPFDRSLDRLKEWTGRSSD
jgi:MFS family permease